MNQNFVTREQAVQLDILGMDEPCFGGYLRDESNCCSNMIKYPAGHHNASYYPRTYGKRSHVNKHIIKAPLNQQVIDWAQNIHGLYPKIIPEYYGDGFNINWQIMWVTIEHLFTPDLNGTFLYGDNGEYLTHHTVLIAMIDKLIEVIQYKNLNGEFQDPRGIHTRGV